MADNPKAQEAPVTTTPAEPMPSSEQTTTEVQPSQTAAVDESQVSAGTERTEVQEENSLELPEGASDRTREQFDKLKTQLRDERAKRVNTQSVFEQLRPSQPAMTQAQINQFVDPMTGNVDVNGLNQAIYSAQQRATNAEQTVQRWIEDQQTKEAFSAHSELNPQNSNFDRSLHNKTRALLLDSMVNPQDYNNKQLSYKEAADLAKGVSSKVIAEAEKVGATKAIEGLTPKEQASLEATGRSDRRTEVSDLDTLKQNTRRGDLGSIVERLKGIPPVGR